MDLKNHQPEYKILIVDNETDAPLRINQSTLVDRVSFIITKFENKEHITEEEKEFIQLTTSFIVNSGTSRQTGKSIAGQEFFEKLIDIIDAQTLGPAFIPSKMYGFGWGNEQEKKIRRDKLSMKGKSPYGPQRRK
jgi:hypothetical protein